MVIFQTYFVIIFVEMQAQCCGGCCKRGKVAQELTCSNIIGDYGDYDADDDADAPTSLVMMLRTAVVIMMTMICRCNFVESLNFEKHIFS